METLDERRTSTLHEGSTAVIDGGIDDEREGHCEPKDELENVGDYIIGRTLGKGTFGKVKLGIHKPSGEKVAIKILEKVMITSMIDVVRLKREIHILKLLRHPSIIQLYDLIETDERIYLVMEYADGGELYTYIVERHRVEEDQARRFFLQLIDAVEYIHSHNIVHRDLKPENLLLDRHKNVKICDFGLSNVYSERRALETPCGSPCYAAPEMVAGDRYDGLSVDLWSCGVVLFAMICGYLPFEDPDHTVLYKKIIKAEYVIPGFISDDAKNLIRSILNVNPDTRYNVQQIKEHPWLAAVTVRRIPPGWFGNKVHRLFLFLNDVDQLGGSTRYGSARVRSAGSCG
jgi:5'-AMP-activated protein kinase catalytic alpha subunit